MPSAWAGGIFLFLIVDKQNFLRLDAELGNGQLENFPVRLGHFNLIRQDNRIEIVVVAAGTQGVGRHS